MTRLLKNTVGSHRQSLLLVVVCLAVLATAFVLTVVKDLQSRKQLEAQISEASRLAERRQTLAPLVTELQKNNAAPMPGDGALPAPIPLPDTSGEEYEKVIGQVLQQCNLKQTVLTPDIQSILSDGDYILVNLTVRGAFSSFRNLILQIGRLQFVSGIERFRVQRLVETNELEMFLQLRIQVASSVDGSHENQ